MTQSQLDRLVADATGEELGEIQSRGFSLLGALDTENDFETGGSVLENTGEQQLEQHPDSFE